MVRVYLSGDPVHDRVLKAFYEGCPEKKELVKDFKYEPSDVAVIFGVYKSKVRKSWPRGKVFRQQRQINKDVIVLETGYIHRGDGEYHHYAAGFNGLNGRADFRNKNMGDDRKKALFYQLSSHVEDPISNGLNAYHRGENILLCSQVPWDASVDHSDHRQWVLETAQKLRAMTSRPIIYRCHPLARGVIPCPAGCVESTDSLYREIENAHAVVTFNSNSGVDATLLGSSVFTSDEGSMVWGISNKDLKDINEPKYPNDTVRKQWLNDICYAQWTPSEMSGGLTWKHLFR